MRIYWWFLSFELAVVGLGACLGVSSHRGCDEIVGDGQ